MALVDAYRRSHPSASSSPPPKAKPLIAAMNGFGEASISRVSACPSCAFALPP